MLVHSFMMFLIGISTIQAAEVDQYCLSYLNGVCFFCENSFLSGSKCKLPSSSISDCWSYKSETECKICKEGFMPTKEGTCHKILIPNCLETNSEGKCIECNNKVKAKDGKCDSSHLCTI